MAEMRLIEGPDPARVKFWDRRAMAELATRSLRDYKRRIFSEGRGGDGQSFPKGVDLVDSGQFQRDFTVVVTSEATATMGPVGASEAYAADLDARYGWSGLSNDDLPALEAALDAAVKDSLRRSGA